MRFGIRDLIGLTAIVAVYAAGMSFLASEGLLGGSWRFLLPMAAPLLVFAAFFGGRLVIQGNQIGRLLTTFRSPFSDYWHLGCIAFFVVTSTLAYADVFPFQPMFLIMPVMFHITKEINGRISHGDQGVAANGTANRWNEYYFALDGPEGRLHAIPRHGARPGKWLAARSIRIPRKYIEEVAAILAAKQDLNQPAENEANEEQAG